MTETEKEINEIKEEVKKELTEQIKWKRPEYLIPINTFDKAELVVKLITVGRWLGFQLGKDVCYGMKLQRGQLLKIRVELFPEDALKLQGDNNSL
ncbi:MAG TPA: hypothetical protein ENI23_09555 [bacterium]|nr:hypothetical protein [bacterium]